MDEKRKVGAVLQVLAGEASVQDAARELGVATEELLAYKALYLEGARSAIRRPARPGRGPWLAASAALLVGALGFIGHARSQDALCEQYLPAPLTTFCAHTPAAASQVNGNFQQLVSWLEGKVGDVDAAGLQTSNVSATGTVSAASVQASGSVNTSALNATRVSSSAYAPPYANWASQGEGAGGAAIYNDDSGFKTLMIVGNNSAGNGRRRVGLWDDVSVAGSLFVSGSIYAEGGLGGRGCTWRQATPFGLNDNTPHTVECVRGEYMSGWQCRATDRLDGECYAKCCRP